jgi:predicted nucleic acid-binding protein
MIVVIDTNILLISIPRRSKYRPIFDAYLNNKISLVITTDILLEYLEITGRKAKTGIADFLEDPDDNKFTDAYLSARADYLVTVDGHFNEVKHIGYPPINIVSPDDFLNIIKSL